MRNGRKSATAAVRFHVVESHALFKSTDLQRLLFCRLCTETQSHRQESRRRDGLAFSFPLVKNSGPRCEQRIHGFHESSSEIYHLSLHGQNAAVGLSASKISSKETQAGLATSIGEVCEKLYIGLGGEFCFTTVSRSLSRESCSTLWKARSTQFSSGFACSSASTLPCNTWKPEPASYEIAPRRVPVFGNRFHTLQVLEESKLAWPTADMKSLLTTTLPADQILEILPSPFDAFAVPLEL